jgi:hypothetical protein
MGIDKNTYTITLRKSINSVKIIKWRQDKRRSNMNIKHIPYALATFIGLIPNGLEFTNDLYDFSHKELDELNSFGAHDYIKRVTRRNGNVILTIDLSKV